MEEEKVLLVLNPFGIYHHFRKRNLLPWYLLFWDFIYFYRILVLLRRFMTLET